MDHPVNITPDYLRDLLLPGAASKRCGLSIDKSTGSMIIEEAPTYEKSAVLFTRSEMNDFSLIKSEFKPRMKRFLEK